MNYSTQNIDKIMQAESFATINELWSLSYFLGIEPEQLKKHINYPEYAIYVVSKKKGGKREIHAPSLELKLLQTRIKDILEVYYNRKRPHYVHGFISKIGDEQRGIVSNAQAHIGKKFLLNIDLKDFFNSVSAKMVRHALDSFMPDVAKAKVLDVISLLCTFGDRLPTGAPSSPVLSNMVAFRLDKLLSAYCDENNITYTRYADDLSFSSNSYFEDWQLEKLKTIIAESGFTINDKKFRINSSKSKQLVTGIVVNEKVNVDRWYIRKIRAILYHWEKKGSVAAYKKHFKLSPKSVEELDGFARKIKGQIEFIGQVRGKEDEIYKKYLSIVKNLQVF